MVYVSEEDKKVKISLGKKAFHKIRALLEIADDDEFLVLLVRDKGKMKDKTLRIVDIIIPPQTVSGGECTLDADKFANQITKMMKDNSEILPLICGILHSHNSMGTFWSPTDNNDIHNVLLKYMAKNSVLVSIVINNDLETMARVLIRTNFGQFEFDNVTVTFDMPLNARLKKECQKIWKKNVKRRTVVQSNIYTTYGTYPRNVSNYAQRNLYGSRLTNEDFFPELSRKEKISEMVRLRRKQRTKGLLPELEWNKLFDLESSLYGYSPSCRDPEDDEEFDFSGAC